MTRAITSRSRGVNDLKSARRFETAFSFSPPGTIAVERDPDSVQQLLVAKRLGQEFDSSCLHGLDGHRNVAVAGDEHDRNVDFRLRQFALKI